MFKFLKRKKRSFKNLKDVISEGETSSGILINERTALGIPAVFSCIRVLAESIANLPLIVYERLGDGAKQRAKTFSLYSILHDSPNHLMSSIELREMLVGHLCVRGNAYCYIERDNGEVKALWPLNPVNMNVRVNNNDLLYEYTFNGTRRKYSREDILHLRGLSSDGIMGYGPLQMFRNTFGSTVAVGDYAANYFKNDASPGGILTTPHSLAADAGKNLKDAWNEGFRGSGKKHKVAILDNELKWEAIGISPQDSQMIETQKFSVVQIARIYRVPLNLIMDYDRSTYSNVTEQNRSFLTHTLTPWLTKIEQAIFRALLTETERKRYFIEHLTHNFLRANTKERYEAYEIGKRAGFLSANEIRGYENLNKISGGDIFETKPPEVKKKSIRNQKRGIENRDRITNAFNPLILDAVSQVVNRESIQIKRAINKYNTGREITSFRSWLDNFYSEIIPEFIKKKVGPVLRSFAITIQKESEAEINIARSDLTNFIEKHIDHYKEGHVRSSLGQLLNLLEEKGVDEIEKRVDEWAKNNHKAEKIAKRQVVTTSNLIFAEVAFGAGYKIMSNTRDESCQWCNQLNGKIVGRGGFMLKSGDWQSSDGQIMNVSRSHVTPSYHKGCDCFLTHV
jgi:HK97 family phage portal protein